MKLQFFVTNNAWAYTFGDSMVSLDQEGMYFENRKQAVYCAKLLGLKVSRAGIVSIIPE